jgi:hypothetical protein
MIENMTDPSWIISASIVLRFFQGIASALI